MEGGECCVEVEEGLEGGGGRRVHGKESKGETRGPGGAVGDCTREKLVFWGYGRVWREVDPSEGDGGMDRQDSKPPPLAGEV